MAELEEKGRAKEFECCGRTKDDSLLNQLARLLRTFAIAVIAHIAAAYWHLS